MTAVPGSPRVLLRRARPWGLLVLAVLLGALAVALLTRRATAPLDPDSTTASGAHALVTLLRERGTDVRRTTSVAAAPAGAAVVVVAPQRYSDAQLRALAAGRRVVLIAPDDRVLAATGSPVRPVAADHADVTVAAGCRDAAPAAGGPVDFEAGTVRYSPAACYGGRVADTPSVTVLGAADLVTDARLGDTGVAALDLNLLGRDATLVWLMPGSDAAGPGTPGPTALLPGWTGAAVGWLLLVGLAAAVWRGRRLGPLVTEPLPVVVHSAETVEGLGRLYRRAGARDRAARSLRAATTARLAARLGVSLSVGETNVGSSNFVALVELSARAAGQPAAQVAAVLSGSVPADDAALVELGRALAELEAAAAGASTHRSGATA